MFYLSFPALETWRLKHKTVILIAFCTGLKFALLSVVEESKPRRTFGPKKKEISGEWRSLHCVGL
jgi:hypothetical protein